MAVLWRSRLCTSLTALASPHSSSSSSLPFIWRCSFDRSWHRRYQRITKRFHAALKVLAKNMPVHASASEPSLVCPLFHSFASNFLPLGFLSPTAYFFHPTFALPVYHSLPCGSKSALSFFTYIHFVQSALLFVIAICHPVCGGKMHLCVSLPLLLIHSLMLLLSSCVCMCAHTAVDLLAFKQMYNDSTWRRPVMWASEPRTSPVSTCAGYSSPILFVFFFSWSIYHKLCKLSQWGDRRPVQAFLWNRQASQEAHCCSGHVCWSTALQQPHITSPPPPHPTPSSLLVRSSPSFIRLQIAFSLLLTLLESRGARRIFIGCFWRSSPSIALARKTQQVHHQQNQLLPDWRGLPSQLQHMLSASPHINPSFMLRVWGVLCSMFGGFICIMGQKAALWPPGFI